MGQFRARHSRRGVVKIRQKRECEPWYKRVMRYASNLLLTSSGIDSPCVRPAFLDAIKGCESAVIVPTASREYKEKNKHAVATHNTLLSIGLKQVDFLDVEFENASNLFGYDVIYIVGGHPFYLMHHLRLSGADAILREINTQGKAFITGSSAGAVVLGPDLRIVKAFDPDLSEGYEDFAGIGLLPFTILPHVNRWEEKLPNLTERLKTFSDETNLPVKIIRDHEALLIDSKGRLIELRRYDESTN